jgi:dephospho-CoA kinase
MATMATTSGKPVIGLLGGIGAGKSTVAAELARLGCAVIDADAIGHDLLADEQVKRDLRALWGEGVFLADGQVDRRAVGKLVFENPAALAALNAVMHPRMRRRMVDRISRWQADPACPAVVLDAALLLETDWHELCTTFVFVSAAAEQRAQRVARSRGWERDAWERREKSQKSLDFKRGRAEYVVDGGSSLPYLRDQVRRLFHRIV